MVKYFFAFLLALILLSCSKEEKLPNQQTTDKKQNEEVENPADTNLTPEEKFSASVLVDFLNDSDDDDLADFLESEIYKQGNNYTGAAVVEVTPSTWLVTLEKDGTTKNYLLQKFVDFKTNEYYFSFKETGLTITDVVSRTKNKIPAGE